MAATQKLIFATKSDYVDAFRRMEAQQPMRYVWYELQKSSTPRVWSKGEEIDGLGKLEGKRVVKPHILVTRADAPLESRAVPQKRGGELHIFDTIANQDSMLLELGGMMDGCLIYGGAQGDPERGLVWRTFEQTFLAPFKRKKSYWVGPDALHMFQNGVRLTSSPAADTSMDLA